jgi:hypothetical protein
MKASLPRWARVTAIVALAAFLPISTACFGKFNLTRKLYDFNRTINPDKWIQWFTFLVLAIIPVYLIALAIDVIFANSIEFWTGNNPIVAQTNTVYGENGEIASLTHNPDGTLDLVMVETNGKVHEMTFVREADGVSAFDNAGNLLGRVENMNGQPQLVAAAGLQ